MKQHRLIAGVLLLALLAATGCAIGGMLEQLGSRWLGDREADGAQVRPFAQEAPTPYPTMTPRPPRATVAPPTSNAEDDAFRLELTESDLNTYIGEQSFSGEGLVVRDASVTITEQNVIATFNATHSESGLSGDITVIGRPHIVDGMLYLQVTSFELGRSFSGFARLIANAMISAALENYSTGDGIPIAIDDAVVLEKVQLYDGHLVLTGRYR